MRRTSLFTWMVVMLSLGFSSEARGQWYGYAPQYGFGPTNEFRYSDYEYADAGAGEDDAGGGYEFGQFEFDEDLYDEAVVGDGLTDSRFYEYQAHDYGIPRGRVYDAFEGPTRDEGMYGPRGVLDPGRYGGVTYGFYENVIGGDDWFYDYYDYGSDYGAIRDFGNYGGVGNRRQFGWGSNQPGYY